MEAISVTQNPCTVILLAICTCLAVYNILGYMSSTPASVARMVGKVEERMDAAWKQRTPRFSIIRHDALQPAQKSLNPLDIVIRSGRDALFERVCGQPAIDGYAHVNVSCLHNSPTNLWHKAYLEAGGRNEDLVAHIEERADYDGLAVGWGINNKKATVEDCAMACKTHKPNPKGSGPFDALPCNAFVWCGEEVCFEPDAHHHTLHDCWLKFTEAPAFPELDMRGSFPDWYRKKHPNAPPEVQWAAGVLLPPGVNLTNGTWSVRWKW